MENTFGLAQVKEAGKLFCLDPTVAPTLPSERSKKYKNRYMELPIRTSMSRNKIHALVESWLEEENWRK